MGFRLDPKNQAMKPWTLPYGEWMTILERGPGLVLGCAPGIRQDTTINVTKVSASHPDGLRIGPMSARLFGTMLLKLLKLERERQLIWKEKNYEERREQLRHRENFFPLPDNWLDTWEEFAAWCKASGGFQIN